ncbi:hypothetical protein SLA2020_296880 [Shorea laevis]
MIRQLLVLFLVVMMVSSCCMAGPRRATVGGIFGEKQHHRVEKEVTTLEGRESTAKATNESNNHHSIPRQDYPSPSNDGNSNGGSG